MIKTKKKRCCKGWEIDGLHEAIAELRKEVSYLKSTQISNELTIYSADKDTAIGMNGLWHKIVCEYEGNICKGGQRPHWFSKWDIKEDGFHLKYFLNEKWKGWHGQYSKSELRYDELPRDVLALHHQVLVEHITKMSIWYPCHIYNDFTGELYRP